MPSCKTQHLQTQNNKPRPSIISQQRIPPHIIPLSNSQRTHIIIILHKMSLSGQSRLSTTNINHRKAPPQRKAGGEKMPITLSPSHSPRRVSTRSFWRTTQDRTPCNTDTSELPVIFYKTNITTHNEKNKFIYNLRRKKKKCG